MEEKELIAQIKKLGQIKPRKDWVVLTKSQILGPEVNQHRVLINFFRVAYGGLFLVLILVGLFGISQRALPGEPLYIFKKIAERTLATFASKEELPKIQLELANKRVEELNKIAQTNQVQKLGPAIKEVQASVSEAAKNLVKTEKTDKETINKIVNLKKNLEKVETSLATRIVSEKDEKIIDESTKEQAEILIKDLENRTLTEEQEKILSEMKELVKEGKYSEALELYLINQ